MCRVISFIRQLVAAPFKVLVWVCGFVPAFDALRLQKLVWFIGRGVDDGVKMIYMAAAKEGLEAGEVVAEDVYSRFPCGRVAAVISMLLVQHGQDFAKANEWVIRAQRDGCDDMEDLLLTKLYLSGQFAEYDATQIVDEMLSRNDLPMEYSRLAIMTKAEGFLRERQWQEAEELLGRILSIEERPHARWMKWVTATAGGDVQEANRQLAAIKGKMPEGKLFAMMALGQLYIGDKNETVKLLQKAEQAGAKPETIESVNPQLASLMRSAEYKEW